MSQVVTMRVLANGGFRTFLAEILKLRILHQIFSFVGTTFEPTCQRGTISTITPLTQGSTEMLVLSRKEGEQLMIGDDIVLTINRINGNRVAIGIEAPRDVRILRGELECHMKVSEGGVAPVAASMENTNVAVASNPHC